MLCAWLLLALLAELPPLEKVQRWEAGRDKWQKLPEILEALQVKEGSTVAEIGPGLGYFIPRLAKVVGGKGRVLAADVEREAVEFLKRRAAAEGWSNVDVIQSSHEDPGLPEGRLDSALIALTYHTMTSPRAVLKQVRRALKPGGRLVICEPTSLSAAKAEEELRGEGFEVVERRDDFCADGFQGGSHRLWLMVARRGR
jgi:ubiquinone/menaquinone biosynthesis C-methylase UbiE